MYGKHSHLFRGVSSEWFACVFVYVITLLAYLWLYDCWFYLLSVAVVNFFFRFFPFVTWISLHRVRLCASIIIMYLVVSFWKKSPTQTKMFCSCVVNSSHAHPYTQAAAQWICTTMKRALSPRYICWEHILIAPKIPPHISRLVIKMFCV